MSKRDARPENPVLAGEADALRRYARAQKATWISAWINLLLTIAQLIVGWFSHSQSLIAHGLHSFSDLASDFLVLWANRQGAHPADAEHPYGHARIETAATLALGLSLAAIGGGILLSCGEQLTRLAEVPPVEWLALWVALATLVAKEALFHYLKRIAEALQSNILLANAWHTRADAASALVVAIGIAGSLAGFRFLDLLAAVLVGFMILKMGVGFAWEAIRELVDTGLSAQEVEEIRATLAATPGVVDLHALRTRRMAHKALVDAHIRVDPRISVSEGHRIAENARQRVIESHPFVADVLVHVDAEDDSSPKPHTALPTRAELESQVRELIGPDTPPLTRLLIHYLGDQVEIEAFFASAFAPGGLMHVEKRLKAQLERFPWISRITLHVQISITHQNSALSTQNAP
ncbi:MAG: cation diffusion facilitator family transporter [Rhodocyclaceae bacterium]|nr:cation diffusion facilitator family transporter [Rhodocyclaceae bacterium]